MRRAVRMRWGTMVAMDDADELEAAARRDRRGRRTVRRAAGRTVPHHPPGRPHQGRARPAAQDATREAQIDAKVRRLATEYELDEGLVSDVLRAVIDRVVAEHRELH